MATVEDVMRAELEARGRCILRDVFGVDLATGPSVSVVTHWQIDEAGNPKIIDATQTQATEADPNPR